VAAKIMEAARDLFEEVEIEVPEGIELPTAIQAPGAPDNTAAETETVSPAEDEQEQAHVQSGGDAAGDSAQPEAAENADEATEKNDGGE
jgi:hypothetical protein